MNRHAALGATLLATLVTVGAAAAQNPASTATTTSDTTASGAVQVNVIGCVQRTPATSADNTTTILPEGETRYILTDVTLAARDAVSGRAGTSRGDLVAETVNQYRLDDAADPSIAPHVGNRVQVSGTVVPRPAGTSGRTTATTAGPMLKVDHIEKVSEGPATCRP